MRITDIKVFPVREEKLKAFVSIVLDECFMVNDIKVIKGKDGLFISMPSRRKRNGKFKDIAHPLNNETRQVMEREILGAYEQALDEPSADRVRPPRPEQRQAGLEPKEAAVEVTAPVGRPESVPEVEPAPDPRPEARRAEREPSAQEPPAAEPAAQEPAAAAPDEAGKSLEEVAELHLRDSFWGT